MHRTYLAGLPVRDADLYKCPQKNAASVLVRSSRCDEFRHTHTGRPKQKFIFPQFRKPEVRDRACGRAGSARGLPRLRTAACLPALASLPARPPLRLAQGRFD